MKEILSSDFKVGILGGGQLGKMLGLAAANWHLPLYFLDDSRNFPAGGVAEEFVEGNFNNYEDVLAFGADKDVLSIEIEHVNTRALETLQAKGVTVHPHPEALDLIKDKGLQKLFYQEHGLPSAPFELFEDENAVRHAVQTGKWQYPFVQKSRTAGYDGKGVAIIRNESDLQHKLLPGSCLLEARVDIQKELAVIVARNADGEIAAFPVVEMDFNPEANLVEFLICPARIDAAIEKAAIELSKRCIETFGICGLLAVELFLTPDQQILINEVAPRPHNSGHHTIDSCYTSQFEQHLRGILNLPLGSTAMKCPSVMVNLLGAEGFSGPTRYFGLEDCLALPGVKLHFYGKSTTKPFRKMGHATVLAENIDEAVRIAKLVQQKLSIQA
ncbi:5-(carboxyamino)imidazole ribonucleotide synthase [Haliscomenobacter hydrossis]|uniref:N5-carboxyaminoimidazole ribonucleotide synthase n=1 Tax=Haliscomenobacter hydrossis (strain ATCC 27775 / DSM 1100 / LMG 10767 / O) TaxID=760192 RepID=F4L2H4_HALH1|nr:5-(carboxyamino)imidazole ribonucleotide synthase [Haliscomenobacter hydrossis]AEE53892.1 phosphoribosylaminoimidazole carboxylase, ATPase subunit [Haliscomenobacter hydrossis DSM 1100]